MKRRHPLVRVAIALAVLALVSHVVGAVLVAVFLFSCHHAALIAAAVAGRLLAGLVPGLHHLLARLIGYRLTRVLIGEPR